VGIDLVFDMLAAHSGGASADRVVAVGDIRALPFAPSVFDLVWCRLTIGYVPEIAQVYRELSRASGPEVQVVVTDFHPDAARAGFTRSFRDTQGKTRTIESYLHEPDAHLHAAKAVGFKLDARLDLRLGSTMERAEHGRSLDEDEQLRNTPLLLALRFSR
jgi:malonyl-CoA O-methyltransferase